MAWWRIVLLFVLVVLGMVMESLAQAEPEVFQDQDCTDDAQCETAKPGSKCEMVSGQDGEGNPIETNKCACIAEQGWHKKEDDSGCLRDVPTTMECHLTRSKCVDANAACINDGTNTGTRRCLCMSGYVTVQSEDKTKYTCGKVITTQQDAECEQCINNNGMCYDTDGDDQKDGCQCKLSQTGEDCGTVHLSVTCTSDMTYICYGPVQEGVDFSAGSKMYTDGHEADVDCLGVVLTNDTKTETCGEGHVLLTLPLSADKRDQCGTTEIAGKTTRLETMVTVTKSSSQDHSHLHFTTYCEYQLYTDGVFQNLHVKAAPGNDRGEFKTGELTLYVHDSNGLPMGSNPQINSGDPVQFLVKLKEADPPIHTAIKVHRCMLSTSGTIKTGVFANNNENTLQVIDEGCPDKEQNIFNENNTFVRNGKGDITSAQTRLVPIPKFGNSPNMFLHCNIILCTAANIALCDPEECGDNNFTSVGRRKRAAVDVENDANMAEATFSLSFKDDRKSAQDSSKDVIGGLAKTEFAAMMVVMAAALVAFIIIATLFVWRMKNKDGKVVEYRHDKPQQFAMPRMERNLKI